MKKVQQFTLNLINDNRFSNHINEETDVMLTNKTYLRLANRFDIDDAMQMIIVINKCVDLQLELECDYNDFEGCHHEIESTIDKFFNYMNLVVSLNDYIKILDMLRDECFDIFDFLIDEFCMIDLESL